MGKNWRDKFRDLCKDIERHITDNPPRLVVPKRTSGPREIPSDWHERYQQERLMPQCNGCHERPLVNVMPLVRGLCGPCRARIDERPEAA